jgi:hypothetical protein
MAPMLMRQEEIDFWRGVDVRMKAACGAPREGRQGVKERHMIETQTLVRFPYSLVPCHQQQHRRRWRWRVEVLRSIEWRKPLKREAAVALVPQQQLQLLMKLLT